jgi:hypothetical protein
MKYGIGFALEENMFLEGLQHTGSAIRKTAGLSGQTTNIWSKRRGHNVQQL